MVSPPQRILVVCLQRLGDVLLTTPLIRSLRLGYPKAQITALVYANTRAMLVGNPDVDVVKTPEDFAWQALPRWFRRYDLAISTQFTDRPSAYAFLAGKRRVGTLPPLDLPEHQWKKVLWHAWLRINWQDQHMVQHGLNLAALAGVLPQPVVVPPRAALPPQFSANPPYVVLHPMPMFAYKAWTKAGWLALIRYFLAKNLSVYLSGGPAEVEQTYVADLAAAFPAQAVHNIAGRYALADLASILQKAQVFVGPDTSITHLAAATGVNTVALFGPSNPCLWGPWPQGWAESVDRSPWQLKKPVQRVANVCIIQGDGDCVPCFKEGCERHQLSFSECLTNLSSQKIIGQVEKFMKK
jgi:heptosyltransferase-3